MFLYMVLNQKKSASRPPPAMCNESTSQKLSSVKEEVCSYQFWKAVRCEFLITLLYVFIGCGTLTVWDDTEDTRTSHDAGDPEDLTMSESVPGPHDKSGSDDVRVALSFGLAAATLVQCVGHISGAHMNPAVTVAKLVTRNVTVLRAVCYVLAQCVGGIAGAGILYGVTPLDHIGTLGVTTMHAHVSLSQAFGVEFMISFILVFTVFANMEPKRVDMGSRSLAIGLAVTVGHLFGMRYTGANMNPARSLGPAVVMNIWTHHWVYWIGPVLGGIIGGFTYEYTHDSSNHLQQLRRSFRRRTTSLKRTRSIQSTNSTASTEMTFSPTSEDLRI